MNEPDQQYYENSMAGLGDRSLFFLHIPKTAGTSTVNLFSKRPFIFTVLREPIDRAISAFQFMKQQSAHMEQKAAAGLISKARARDYAKARDLSLSEFVRNEPLAAARHLGNIQVELLTCPDLEKRHRYDDNYEIAVSAADLDLAMERLSTFDAVGIMERLPESIELLTYALRTRPFDQLAWSNKAQIRPLVEEWDEDTLEALRALTFYDGKLYNFAKEMFEQRRRLMLRELLALQADQADAVAKPSSRRLPSSFTSGTPVPGEGWYAPEHDGTRWFNWTGPTSDSWIELGTPAGTEFVLHMCILHALKADSLFDLGLLVNGVPLKTNVCQDSIGHTISAKVDAHLLRDAGRGNRIAIHVPHPVRPCDVDLKNHDSRTLGLAVHRIELKSVA
jgi:hypothetical protein